MARRKSTYKPSARRSAAVIAMVDKGLYESAKALREEIIRTWMQVAAYPGYTSGEHVSSPPKAAEILISVASSKSGKRTVNVYSPATDENGAPYPAFWELGHRNVITGRYERVEIFRPAIERFSSRYKSVFAKQIKASPFGQMLEGGPELFSTSGAARITE